MTLLAIGRVFDGLDVAPSKATWDGDTLTLEGPLHIPTATSNRFDVLKACRDRFNALVDNRDERHVPVTFTEDPSWDGFYQPLSASMNFEEHHPSSAYARWSCTLRRSGAGSLPQLEITSSHTVRTNPHSITNASIAGLWPPVIGMPGTAIDLYATNASFVGHGSRTSSTGVVKWAEASAIRPTTIAWVYSIPPADTYVGACEIRHTYGSAANQLVLGRYAPPLWSGMTISNGLVRVNVHPSSTDRLLVEVFDGSTWDALSSSSVGWQLGSIYTSTITWDWANARVQIIRNSPEFVAIRVFAPDAGGKAVFGRVWLDLSIRRGARHVAGVIQSDWTPSPSGNYFTLQPSSSIAATVITGGLRATSTDAQGNRAIWAIAGTPGASASTVTGRIEQTDSGNLMTFMVGADVNAPASSPDQPADILTDWIDAASGTQQVVRR